MATIVVHGTMTVKAARHSPWWWSSWQERGFCWALQQGMVEAGRQHDVWRVGGRPVSQIHEFTRGAAINPWTGLEKRFAHHLGHFTWGGADDPAQRREAGDKLALYLNAIYAASPAEPIRIVAHSHGCNVVKGASMSGELDPRVHIQEAVFLACPHFLCENPVAFAHRVDPRRFRVILNLYSNSDTVQTRFAERFPGPFGARVTDYLPMTAFRKDRDSAAKDVYRDYAIPTADQGTKAHTAMHGAVVGYLVGRWLAVGNFPTIYKELEGRQVPAADFGG